MHFLVDFSKKEVPLIKILATSLDRKIKLEKNINKVTSVSEEETNKLVVRVGVGKELEDVIDRLNFTPMVLPMIPSATLGKTRKPEIIVKLISFQKRYFDLDQGARSRIESDVREDFLKKNS